MALTQASEGGLKISNAGTNGQYLQKQSGNTGGLTWADVPAGVGGATGVDFNDNVKIRSGTGNDLEIYHDGNNGYIKGSGAACGGITIDNSADADQNISIQAGQDIYLKVSDGSETAVRCERGGKVELYNDAVKKFETTSDGTQTTGLASVDYTVTQTTGNYAALNLETLSSGTSDGDFATGIDFRADGTNSARMFATKDGKWGVLTNDLGSYAIRSISEGTVELYHDNSKKLETSATGATVTGTLVAGGLTVDTNTLHVNASDNRVGIGTASPASILHVESSSPSIRFVDSDASGGYGMVGVNNTSGSLVMRSDDQNALANSYMGFEVDGATKMYINSSGNVGIGTTSPSSKLEVNGTVSDSKGNLRSIPQNTKTANYDLVAADAGKHILCNTASITITYDPDDFNIGDAITIINNTTGNVNVHNASNTNMQSTLGNGNRVLASRGVATILTIDGSATGTGYISGAGLS